MRLLLATCNLSLSKQLGVLSSRIEAKLKRFPRLDPRCCDRSRRTTGEHPVWRAILRNINLARSAVSGIPSYRGCAGSFAYGHWIGRRRNRCGGCRGTSSRRIRLGLGVFRWPASSEEE